MVSIGALWLPILLSAVIVFIASALIWMVVGYHKNDYKPLPDEDAAIAALRPQALRPGLFVVPHTKDWKNVSPATLEKYETGPVAMITVLPNGRPAMGKSLSLWFLFNIVIGVFVAYMAGETLPEGTHYLRVFQIAGTVAILAHGAGSVTSAIWWGRPWSVTLKELVDAVIYGLLVAGTFGWLWPQ